MKRKFATSCIVIAALLTPVAARAADPDATQTRPLIFVKDSAIMTRIKARLAEEKTANLAHVKVDG